MANLPIPAPGTVLAARYVVGQDSHAASGYVDARDTSADRPVLVRVHAPGAAAHDAAAAAGLDHPNVARVLDTGSDAALGIGYTVMESVAGGTLGALLTQRGAPPQQLAERMLREALAGVAAGHAAGLVHGLIHPDSLFLARGEGQRLRLVVLGFGAGGAEAALTAVTGRYAAPERLRRGEPIAPTADVFSLGVVAYELLAGLPEDWRSILVALARRQPVTVPAPRARQPQLSAALSDAILRALAADPADRWTDAADFLAALPRAAAAGPATAPRAESPAPRLPAVANAAAPPPASASAASLPVTAPAVAAAGAVAAPQLAAAAASAAAPPAPASAPIPDPASAAASAAAPAVPPTASAPVLSGAPAASSAPPAPKRATTLAATDLRDHIYIPPPLPKPSPAAATPPKAPVEVPPQVSSAPPAVPPSAGIPRVVPSGAVGLPIPEVTVSKAAPPAPEHSVTAPADGRRLDEPAPASPVGTAASVAAAATPPAPAPAPAAAPTAVTPRGKHPVEAPTVPRRRALGRLAGDARSGPGAPRRMAVPAAVVTALLVVAALGYGMMRGPAGAPPLTAAGLAQAAVPPAAEGDGLPAENLPPESLAVAPEAEAAPAPAPPPAAAAEPSAAQTAAEQRARDDERRRQEEQRREDARRREEERLRTQSTAAAAPPAQQAQAPQAPTPPAPAPQAPPATTVASPTTAIATREAPSQPQPAANPNRIYAAHEVDEPPSLTNRADVQRASARAYPITLSGSGIGGRMVVSFVVLENGRVDPASISVSQSPHAALSAAAGQVLAAARFRPARAGGRPVRTAVSMPIDWSDGR